MTLPVPRGADEHGTLANDLGTGTVTAVFPATALDSAPPLPAARAVRHCRDVLVVDVARLCGAGIERTLRELTDRPRLLRMLNTTWGDLEWSRQVAPDGPGLVALYGLVDDDYFALPGDLAFALIDPQVADPVHLGEMFDRWRYLSSSEPEGYRAGEVLVADPAHRRSRVLRLRAPAGPEMAADWLGQLRAGLIGDLVRPWPGPGPVARVVRAFLSAPAWCPTGYRAAGGVAGTAVLDALAAEMGPDRSWIRPAYAGSGPLVTGGAVVDGHTVVRGLFAGRQQADELAYTVGPWAARTADRWQTLPAGFVPPADLLASATTDADLAAVVLTYNRLRSHGLGLEDAADATVAVLAPTTE